MRLPWLAESFLFEMREIPIRKGLRTSFCPNQTKTMDFSHESEALLTEIASFAAIPKYSQCFLA